jgi:hypothetical protein
MSLAIKWGDEAPESSGFLFFDAVQTYVQNYSGKITQHPVDGSGLISDHFVKSNPVITISAVITGVDISTGTFLISNPENTETPYNAQVAPAATSVNSTDNSLLTRFLPNSIGQFLPDTIPEVVMADSRDNILEDIRDMLIRLVYSGKKYNDITQQFDSVIQTVKLYEYQGSVIVRQLPTFDSEKLVITDVTFKEDANSGFALYCDIRFEQVEFVALQKTVIPKDVAAALNKKAPSNSNKGKAESTPQPVPEEKDDTDPEKNNYSKTVKQTYGIGTPLNIGGL